MANLTFTGKIEYVSPVATGLSRQGMAYSKQFIVVSDESGQYPNKMKFDLIKKDEVTNRIGETVTVHYNANVNEYNGNYYQGLNVWKIELNSGLQSNQSSNEPIF